MNNDGVVPFDGIEPPEWMPEEMRTYFRAVTREYRNRGLRLESTHLGSVALLASTLAKIAQKRRLLTSGDAAQKAAADLIDFVLVVLGLVGDGGTGLPLEVLCRLMLTPESTHDEVARLMREANQSGDNDPEGCVD